MDENKRVQLIARRTVLAKGAGTLAAIAVLVSPVRPAFSKAKSAKEDFFFQETPDDDTGRKCTGCINFTAKSTGQYGVDSGECSLLEGDVCNHCYCGGWTDKNDRSAKKAGT